MQKESDESCSSSIDWSEIRKKTDAIKKKVEASLKHKEKIKSEKEAKQATIDHELQRLKVHQLARQKIKQKKPIDKVYYVNGKIYKAPKLLKPKKWITERLYKHFWKIMEPKFDIKTRIKSEELVCKLSAAHSLISKKKIYKNYKAELDNLMVTMAEFGVIETRHDFNIFCKKFMPPDFCYKVIPMLLPGNIPNIPFNPFNGFEPILEDEDLISNLILPDNDSESE